MEIKETIKVRRKLTREQRYAIALVNDGQTSLIWQNAFDYLEIERIDASSYKDEKLFGTAIFEKEIYRKPTKEELFAYHVIEVFKYCGEEFKCKFKIYFERSNEIMKDKAMVILNG